MMRAGNELTLKQKGSARIEQELDCLPLPSLPSIYFSSVLMMAVMMMTIRTTMMMMTMVVVMMMMTTVMMMTMMMMMTMIFYEVHRSSLGPFICPSKQSRPRSVPNQAHPPMHS